MGMKKNGGGAGGGGREAGGGGAGGRGRGADGGGRTLSARQGPHAKTSREVSDAGGCQVLPKCRGLPGAPAVRAGWQRRRNIKDILFVFYEKTKDTL